MRTAPAEHARSEADLTARARIRDAAIQCFASEGFDASFRTIAARAGVSAALITHHFGSKAVLRAACDAEVLRRYRALKSDGVTQPSAHLLGALETPGMSADLLVYILRAVLAGGPTARAFLEHLIDDAREVMAEAVESGLVRRSRNEEARLRYLTFASVGALAVQFVTGSATAPDEFAASLRTEQQDSILPILELFTEGLFADRTMLDDYLAYVEHTDTHPTRPATSRSRP